MNATPRSYTPCPPLVIDPRARVPWTFLVESVRGPVPPGGDYSVVGFEDSICIARWTLDDLVDALVHSRAELLADVTALCTRRWCALVVEGTFEAVLAGRYRSKAHPNSVAGSIVSLLADGAPLIFIGNQNAAAALAERLLTKFHSRASDPRNA